MSSLQTGYSVTTPPTPPTGGVGLEVEYVPPVYVTLGEAVEMVPLPENVAPAGATMTADASKPTVSRAVRCMGSLPARRGTVATRISGGPGARHPFALVWPGASGT